MKNPFFHCSECGESTDDMVNKGKYLKRTSPLGSDFVGRCAPSCNYHELRTNGSTALNNALDDNTLFCRRGKVEMDELIIELDILDSKKSSIEIDIIRFTEYGRYPEDHEFARIVELCEKLKFTISKIEVLQELKETLDSNTK